MGAHPAVGRAGAGDGGEFGFGEGGWGEAGGLGGSQARLGLLPAAGSRRRRSGGHRGGACGAAAAISRSWPSARTAMSRSRLRWSTSGWRRMVPVAEQGASSRTASRGAGGCHSAASAWMIWAVRRRRARFSARRARRRSSRSTAKTVAPAAASWAAFPPGAAQRSAMVSPGWAAEERAGMAAAASCTQNLPSAKPGRSATRVPAGRADGAGGEEGAAFGGGARLGPE